jgi:hypothetical protein
MTGPPAEGPIRVRPDWVCEVASPSNRWRDRGREADLYLRVGIALDAGGFLPPLP